MLALVGYRTVELGRDIGVDSASPAVAEPLIERSPHRERFAPHRDSLVAQHRLITRGGARVMRHVCGGGATTITGRRWVRMEVWLSRSE